MNYSYVHQLDFTNKITSYNTWRIDYILKWMDDPSPVERQVRIFGLSYADFAPVEEDE